MFLSRTTFQSLVLNVLHKRVQINKLFRSQSYTILALKNFAVNVNRLSDVEIVEIQILLKFWLLT